MVSDVFNLWHPYSEGADLAAVCREAALSALEEDVGSERVSARHFDAALARVPASPPPSVGLCCASSPWLESTSSTRPGFKV